MPITKDGNNIIQYTAPEDDIRARETGVHRQDGFAICGVKDQLKQFQFQVDPAANASTIILKANASSSGTVEITLPATSGTLTTGAFSDSFTTIQTDAGTSPVASSPTDTLTLTSSDASITITGNSTTDTIDLVASVSATPGGANTQFQYNNAGAFGGIANMTYDGTDVTIADGANLIPQGAGTNSTEIGASAVAGGTNNIAIGDSANTYAGESNIAIGKSCVAGVGNSTGNVAIGTVSKAGGNGVSNYGTAVGNSANNNSGAGVAIGSNSGDAVTPQLSIAIGYDCKWNSTSDGQIAIGRGARTTAGNQLVIGSAATPANDYYFGEGDTSATPSDISFNATGGAGTDIAAGDFVVAAGRSTGNADPGEVILQTTKAGTTGSTLQTLVQTARFDNQNCVLGDPSIATTSTDGFVYIPTAAGPPTGTPTAYSGFVPLYYDGTNQNFYIYNGAWRSTTLA